MRRAGGLMKGGDGDGDELKMEKEVGGKRGS
jgi:hypothetical protein